MINNNKLTALPNCKCVVSKTIHDLTLSFELSQLLVYSFSYGYCTSVMSQVLCKYMSHVLYKCMVMLYVHTCSL